MKFAKPRHPKFMAVLLGLLILSSIFFASVVAGRSSYKGQQWFTQRLAELGDARAQSNVGNMYFYGQGVYINIPQALEWYRKAAEQGNTDALQQLIAIYSEGQRVPKNDAEAFRWAKVGAEKNIGWAMNTLGYYYETGTGTAQDYALALDWYRKSTADTSRYANPSMGRFNVGRMYDQGLGVPADPIEAEKWISRAADAGWSPAIGWMGMAYETGRGVPKDLNKAAAYYQSSIDAGDVRGYLALARLYSLDDSPLKDLDKAEDIIRQAHALRVEGAAAVIGYLALMNLQDKSGTRAQKAYDLASLAAREGDPQAEAVLGDMFMQGTFVKADPDQAAQWYRKAAEGGYTQVKSARIDDAAAKCAADRANDAAIPFCVVAAAAGVPQALFAVGEVYELGLGGYAIDLPRAVENFTQSAKAGYLPAQQRLAYMYASGEKIEKNVVEAYAWYGVIAARRDITGKQRANAEQGRVFAFGYMPDDDKPVARAKVKEYQQSGVPVTVSGGEEETHESHEEGEARTIGE